MGGYVDISGIIVTLLTIGKLALELVLIVFLIIFVRQLISYYRSK